MEAGAFVNARLNNLTEVNYHNGDKYRGNFKDGRVNGMGTMNYNYSIPGTKGAEFEQAEYQGNWKAGKRDGYGSMTWQDGSAFKGIWKSDIRFEGEMIMSNGYRYRGGFRNDKFHGMARLLLTNDVVFEGEFEHGTCSAIGRLLYPNGDAYFGQHKQFVKDGYGKLVTFDGSVFEGKWENDRKNGRGRHVNFETGDIYVGEYNDGKRSG